METSEKGKELLYPYVSVNCVLLGVKEDHLCVLLVEHKDGETNQKQYQLPGSPVYENEDFEDTAYRVLKGTARVKRGQLKPFQCFGAPPSTKDSEDLLELEKRFNRKIDRVVTITYLALCKTVKKPSSGNPSVMWVPVDEVPPMSFGHKEIVETAVEEIRKWIELVPILVLDYLPFRFTAYQLRHTFEIIYNKEMDVRNFHKKMITWDYIVRTDDVETGVAHRAARYYRFDKVKYNKLYAGFNKI